MLFQSEKVEGREAYAPPFEHTVEDDDAAELGTTFRVEAWRWAQLTSRIAKLGYKQELRRNFSMIEIFGIAFSIMGQLRLICQLQPNSILWESFGAYLQSIDFYMLFMSHSFSLDMTRSIL